MSGDMFKGNVKKEYIKIVWFSLIFASSIFFASFVFYLMFALFYEKMDDLTRMVLFVLSCLCLLASILYPILSVFAIRNHSKFPLLTKILIKPYVLKH